MIAAPTGIGAHCKSCYFFFFAGFFAAFFFAGAFFFVAMNADPPFLKNYPFGIAMGMYVILR
jgi:hypothetical protein